jgi:signal transduction histidine kinase
VRVEDTGPGIPAERLSAIFEPFVQVDRRGNGRGGGTGLGLTISRRLARQMGGEVSVESAVGVGSAFVVWLPVAPLESLRTGGGA